MKLATDIYKPIKKTAVSVVRKLSKYHIGLAIVIFLVVLGLALGNWFGFVQFSPKIEEARAAVTVNRLQSETAADGATSSATFGATPTEGNLLIAISAHRREGITPSITGSGWTLVINRCYALVSGTCGTPDNQSRRALAMWWKLAGASEPTNVQTSWSPSSNNGLIIQEFEIVGGGTFLFDVQTSNDSATTFVSSLTTGTTTPSAQADSLLVTAMMSRALTGAASWTNGVAGNIYFDASGSGDIVGMNTGFGVDTTQSTKESTGSWGTAQKATTGILVFSVTETPLIPSPIPGTIEAEAYNLGGEGVAYHDTTAGNLGDGTCRNDDVDMKDTTDVGGGCTIGFFETGEWLKYDVNIAVSGTYLLEARIANGIAATHTFFIEQDGVDVTGPVSVPPTGGWETFATIQHPGVSLSAGDHTLRLVSNDFFDINWMRWSTSTPQDPPTVTTDSATNVTTSTATLNGSANPNGAGTTGWFRYDTSPGTCNETFGTPTPTNSLGSGTSTVSYSENITDLSPSIPYYFCAIAENANGKVFGSVLTFTTDDISSISGYLISSTFDTGIAGGVKINTVLWQGVIGAGTSAVKFKIASANCSNGADDPPTCTTNAGWGGSKTSGDGALIGPDGTSSTFYTTTAPNIPAVLATDQHNNVRYFRYLVELSRSSLLDDSPIVRDVIINWSP